MKILLPTLSLLIVIWLSTLKPVEHGYDKADIEAVNQLISVNTKRQKIMDVWNLAESDISEPVVLWK